ncbi:MAG: glycosyltransferase family 2 protein [bacterium]|jgi:glycosyltransferase involved in cell wall biosynthesis
MANYPVSVSAFFPAHNEVENITGLVKKTAQVLQENVEDYEIIIVDDGSQDGTAELADRLAQEYPHVRAVHHEVNRGYGGAVKTGIQSCTKDWIFFTDGDAQFDVNEIAELLKYIDEYDAVVGYRMDRRDAAHRKLFAFCWGMLIRFLFGFGYKDLDCAFKLFRRKYFDGVDMKAEGAVISVELFSILKRNGAKVKQIGVHHYPRVAGQQSGGSPRVVLRAFKELFLLYRWLKV